MKYIRVQNITAPTVWVEDTLQEGRWDAEFVHPDYLDSHEVVLNAKGFMPTPLGHLLTPKHGLTKGATPPGADYPSTGIPFLRVQNVSEGYIDLSDHCFISEQMDQAIVGSRLQPEDIIFTITGSIGRVATVPPYLKMANINQHLARIRLIDPSQRYYLIAFLISKYGQAQVWRRSLGLTRPAINYDQIRAIPIPLPQDKRLMKYIGELIMQSEMLLGRASELQKQAESLFHEFINLTFLESKLSTLENTLWNWVLMTDMQERWDAEFFQKSFQVLLEHLSSYNPIQLQKLIEKPHKGNQPEYVSDLNEPDLVPVLTGSEIDPYFINLEKARRVSFSYHKAATASALQENDIVFTVTGPPLGEAALVRKHHLPCNLASEVVRIQKKPEAFSGYLTIVFNSMIGRIQVSQWCRGIRQKHLYSDQILNFVFPLLDKRTMEIIDLMVKDAEDKRGEAHCLLRQAKQEIEALLEGRIEPFALLRRTQKRS